MYNRNCHGKGGGGMEHERVLEQCLPTQLELQKQNLPSPLL
jgi:hypothetical protein